MDDWEEAAIKNQKDIIGQAKLLKIWRTAVL